MRKLVLALVALLTLALDAPQPHEANAEEPVTGLGVVRRFESKALGEMREINVLLPLAYAEHPDERFPVIYLLDGAVDEDYFHVAGLVRFFEMYELMPPSILVGIANVDRYRDFTSPTQVEQERRNIPNAGNSKNFRRYLSEELFPYVESEFRATAHRAILGQSMGGLLATEILLESPEDFDAYVIVSPSLWWNEYHMVSAFAGAFAMQTDLRARVYVALGEEGEGMQSGVEGFLNALRNHPSAGVQWHYQPLPEESHATVLHRALYRAFEWLYGEEYPGL